MNTRSTFIPHGEPPKPMEPRERALDHPARPAEPAAMAAIAAGQHGRDATLAQFGAMPFRVVSSVALHAARTPTGRAGAATDRRHRIDQVEELADIVAIGGRQPRDERNPVRVGKNVMFRPGLAAIGRVRSSFFPPRNARSEALSTIARAKSRSPRRRNSASNTVWRCFQTPARCQRTRRRQHVEPDPQPISSGSMFQGRPLRSTNKMPVNTARSGIGLRPAYRLLRRRRFGSSGSMRVHRSSSSNGLVMHGRLLVGHAKVPSPGSKYKRQVT